MFQGYIFEFSGHSILPCFWVIDTNHGGIPLYWLIHRDPDFMAFVTGQ